MTSSIFSVKDRVVVITGGSGRLGRQFTTMLLEAGAKVASLDLPQADGIDLRHQNLLTLSADVTSKTSLESAASEIRAKWGQVYGLINNAAVDSPPNAPAEENGPFEMYPESSWDRIMDVNVKGVFLSCQVFGGIMAEAGKGSIVLINSIYGMVSPDQRIYEYRRITGQEFYKPVAYSVSKSAIQNLTRYLATYWAGKNVRVNTLTLGGVFAGQEAPFLKGYCDKVPMGRMANPDEYNGAVIFLLSNAASYMTGSNLVIDGGWTAW